MDNDGIDGIISKASKERTLSPFFQTFLVEVKVTYIGVIITSDKR